MSSLDRGRRRLQIFAFVVAAGFGALAFATWWTGRENPREGSEVLSRGGPALRIGRIPTSYKAVFRVDNRAQDLVVTTERVWVRRPFQSRIETYRGPPPGDGRPTLRQSAFGVLASRSERAAPLNLAAPPSLASGDLRIDAALSAALADRTILRRERRDVYGRECQVYRAGGPVFAGDIERYVPRRGDYADFCVDANGIVVEEAWVLGDRLVQRRVAVEVEIDPAIDKSVFEIDVPASPGLQRGAVERIETPRPEGLWTLPEPPRGYDDLGTYGVVIPSSAVPQLGDILPGVGPTSTSDVFVSGPDLLVIDQDPSLAQVIQQESRPTRDVNIPGLRDAKLIIDARMSEVRGIARSGSVVRIFGTLPPPDLLELARKLEIPDAA